VTVIKARSARSYRASARRFATWALLILASLVSVFPFLWMLRTSVAEDTFFSGFALIPERFTFEHFINAWTDAGMGRAMAVGLTVTIATLALQLVTGVPAAYVLAKVPFRGRGAVIALVLIALLVPSQAVMVPLFLGVSYAGFSNSLAALILPFGTTAFGIFLLRQYMQSIPDAVIDAARMDGFGTVRTLWNVVVPMSRPAILTFSLFSVFGSWNEYLWPLLVARSPELRTPPLALALFQNADVGYDYGGLAAGAVIVTLPILVLFLLTRRSFVAGLSGGEVVG
jgi:multiple sugar transport system permease protein